MKLSWLAGLAGLPEDAQDEKVAAALESRITLAKGLESEVSALKTSLEQSSAQAQALDARAKQAEAARDNAMLALENLPPAPTPMPAPEAPAGKFKPGDEVLYSGTPGKVKSVMGPEMVCELEDGRFAPESRLESVTSPAAVAFKQRLEVLEKFAAGVTGHTTSADALRSMALQEGMDHFSKCLDAIKASVPVDAKARGINQGVLEALAPRQSATPSKGSDRQAKIRNRIGGN